MAIIRRKMSGKIRILYMYPKGWCTPNIVYCGTVNTQKMREKVRLHNERYIEMFLQRNKSYVEKYVNGY